MAATRTVLIKTPSLPNFVEIGESRVDVTELTDGEIDAIGKDWIAAFKLHAKNRRSNRDRETVQALRQMSVKSK